MVEQYLFILPVIFYEFLSISVTRAIMPELFIEAFGNYVYFVLGVVETIKGILAFMTCPLVGKVSDKVGRKICLMCTVVGTTAPVCILAFTLDMRVYMVAQALSGIWAGTFTLTFAYIADCVEAKKRAPAYGLALASLGLSFTIGPVSGGYLYRSFGPRAVFLTSLLLALLDVAYIALVLPESNPKATVRFDTEAINQRRKAFFAGSGVVGGGCDDAAVASEALIPSAYSPLDALEVFAGDPLLSQVARVTFLYYTGVWAVVSTLMVFLVNRFNLDQVYLGYLLGSYGAATMVSEGCLVRLLVPRLGERTCLRIGLVAFAAQCAVIGLATAAEHIWFAIFFSLFSNLVYPSLSSLVSASVTDEQQGEAQGAINGVRALTEGFGPLCFGLLMNVFEDSRFPGFPYLVGSLITCLALATSARIPSEDEYADYVDAKRAEVEGAGEMERKGLLCEQQEQQQQQQQQHVVSRRAQQRSGGGGHDREEEKEEGVDGDSEDGEDDEWARASREAAARDAAFETRQKRSGGRGGLQGALVATVTAAPAVPLRGVQQALTQKEER